MIAQQTKAIAFTDTGKSAHFDGRLLSDVQMVSAQAVVVAALWITEDPPTQGAPEVLPPVFGE